jgi:outer membrane protein
MKSKVLGLVILAFAIFISSSATAWAKTGYFDIQAVLQQSRWGKQSNDEFKSQGERVKADVEEKARAFKSAKEEFDKKKDVLDEKSRNKRIKELQDMQQEGEKLLMESNAKLNKLSNDLTGPLVDKILEIVKRIGRDEKYDYIFEREKAGIVYATDKEDLTKKIIAELDKSSPRK